MSTRAHASDSQRAQELRKFFVPFDPLSSAAAEERAREIDTSLLDDGALDSYAEAVMWRLDAKRAMVSLVDRQTQYFLAGTVRQDDQPEVERHWYGCTTVPTRGGLCENTLAVTGEDDENLCFVVRDLSKDDRFCHLPVVDGSIAKLRFYAGAPITTSRGVNIGSFFIFDEKPRPNGLTPQHRKFLCQSAAHVMRHLEIKREAAERRRLAMMSLGIARFLESNTRDQEQSADIYGPPTGTDTVSEENQSTKQDAKERKLDVPNQLKRAMKRAADILCDSLELNVGGVIVLDTAAGITEAYLEDTVAQSELEAIVETTGRNPSRRPDDASPLEPGAIISVPPGRNKLEMRSQSSHAQALPARVLATAIGKDFDREHAPRSLNQKVLQSLVKSYPKGNVWYIDEEGFFPSLEQMDPDIGASEITVMGRRRSVSTTTFKRQRVEAKLLSQTFAKARQILFIPLWDAAARRWHSGCCVWSQSPVPVFTVDSEIAFLAAFTNCVMAEVSRLDAIAADQVKADFISSISHEFRSPMHAILASAEFLRETDCSEEQAGLIATIQNSGYTLLDTINHVLDYTKINSFERESKRRSGSGSSQALLQNELFAVTNLAVLTEEIVSGMITAKYFSTSFGVNDPRFAAPSDSTSDSPISKLPKLEVERVKITLDFACRDWKFLTQPGALRHIIINIFGNAQKYTDTGSIRVSLTAEEAETSQQEKTEHESRGFSVIILTIEDTGRGMSADFLNKSLYTPFEQEDTFASGVGLGLSIVRSILDQLDGTIKVWSEIGKGTKVQVRLPLQNIPPEERDKLRDPTLHDPASKFEQAEQCIEAVRALSEGKVIACRRKDDKKSKSAVGGSSTLDVVEQYLGRWLGYTVTTFSDWDAFSKADLIIADEDDSWPDLASRPSLAPIFLICHSRSSLSNKKREPHPEIASFILGPVGPYKLADSLLSYFRKSEDEDISETVPSGQQTSLNEMGKLIGSPLAPQGDPATISSVLMNSPEGLRTPRPSLKPPGEQAYPLVFGNEEMLRENHMGPKPPLTPASSGSRIKTRLPERPAPKGRPLHILIVDDNEINLQLLQRYLNKRKMDSFDMARNGIEAVSAFRNASSSVPHDLIFMDLSMPEMDGFEATRQIRQYEVTLQNRRREERRVSSGSPQNQQRVYIVALTGLAAQRDREEAVNSGFDDYMTKPISFQKIGKVLTEQSAL